ncbi:hypothetical protein LCGC14_0384210 [marine sediment metagenome]|uniref:Uncharacterized protein n=1 Tax=marine sediment metagenome TaxID=412755 RepID=A0A0F9TJG6_9ZZZZ
METDETSRGRSEERVERITEKPCALVYNTFFEPGEVVEIRAFGLARSNKAWEGFAGGTGIVYGYFDNADAFGQAAEALDRAKATGVYFTLNPTNPDLLARAANRLKAAKAKTPVTSDKDIECIRWLPVDLDPVRSSGISSSAEELENAEDLRDRIISWMSESGFDKWIAACSGNGTHAVFRTHEDLPNIQPIVDIIRGGVEAIADKFSNRTVHVDRKVFNPSRIWKVYGTTARKGDHTENRPHRKSYIESIS